MATLTAAAVLFVLLVALEWLFWLSPFQAAVDTMTRRMGAWFYLFSPHYGARLLLLLMALWVWKPNLWPVFAPGAGWFYSVALGVAYILLMSAVGPRFGLIEHRTFWPRVQAWLREDPASLLRHTFYLLLYPGFVEELLFRWFFVAALWPAIGWWTLVLSPVLNMIWHLPVWLAMVRGQGADVRGQWRALGGMVAAATPFAVLLTLSAITTQNLAGAVLAHAFGDWCGVVQRRQLTRG